MASFATGEAPLDGSRLRQRRSRLSDVKRPKHAWKFDVCPPRRRPARPEPSTGASPDTNGWRRQTPETVSEDSLRDHRREDHRQ